MAKTTKEMIEVMKSYEEGKKIECKNKYKEIISTFVKPDELSWDWLDYDYHVKEESKYRPYTDIEENKPLIPITEDMGSLKICGLNYTVKSTDDLNIVGESSALNQTITVCNYLPEQYQRMVLIHEWLHQVLHHHGYINETLNEQLIQCLAIELIENKFKLDIIKGE